MVDSKKSGSARAKSKKEKTLVVVDSPQVRIAENEVGISVKDLANIYVLESIKGFGPQKFKKIHEAKVALAAVLKDPAILPIKGKRGDEFRKAISAITNETREIRRQWAEQQILVAHKLHARILTYNNPAYPRTVYDSNNPMAVLYVRGKLSLLQTKSVACVGSRKIDGRYSQLHEEFVKVAIGCGFTIVSGFALGADSIGHRAAFESGGNTICVMPCGLDRPFPPENRVLWDRFLASQTAAFVSEFPFGRRAASLTLRKRNKLIVAFVRGVLISQSSEKGGAMNAYNFAREQRKPVATFADDGSPATSGNKLISEERLLTDSVFPMRRDDSAFETWLRQLSSST
jgi:DNA protecting protein DprA